MKHSIIKSILFLSIAGLFGALLYSVFRSGYFYQFDSDEYFHVNLVYLYAKGYQPYADIYNSFYTPFFQVVIAPAFWIKGYTFAALYASRSIMIALFGIRLIAALFLIKTLWNKRTALLFLPLYLFDPFTVFTAMQIRPDNLMMTTYTIGLAVLAWAMTHRSTRLLLASAFMFGFTLVIFLKILPSVLVLLGIVAIWMYKRRSIQLLPPYIIFFLLPIALFLLWAETQRILPEMVQQLLADARDAYTVFRILVPFGSFHRPDNIYIYGMMGMPLTWVYVWILPLLGAAGWFATIQNALTKKADTLRVTLQIVLAVSMVVQLAALFMVPVVFIQHYLPVNWLFALFTAVALDTTLTNVYPYRMLSFISIAGVSVVFLLVAKTSYVANMARSTMLSTEKIAYFEKRWKQIGPQEEVFPNFLFRPLIYPVSYGYYIGNIPLSIFVRLPSIPDILETRNIRTLLLDEYAMSNLPPTTTQYIHAQYSRVEGDDELMKRNE